MKKTILLALLITISVLSSCTNGDWEFPDYEYQAVYFAYQYPVRTVTLGEDIFDTSSDNEGKINIMATLAGLYENSQTVSIDIQVDNSMTQGLLFEEGGAEIQPLPASYYSLASNEIVIKKGQLTGGVEVQLTDAFFSDPKSLSNNYVIPVRMTNIKNVDSILSGVPLASNPRRGVLSDWEVQPKDFTFYAVKYINPWDGFYLRRGKDVIEGKNGNSALDAVVERREEYVVDDEVIKLTSQSLHQINLPLIFQNEEGNNMNVTLLVSIDEEGNATISSSDPESYAASGNGEFVKDGEKNSWGSQDRDALYLSYEIDLDEMHVSTSDTLVMRDRGVAIETFTPVVSTSSD